MKYIIDWDLLRPAALILADKHNKSCTYVYAEACKSFIAAMDAVADPARITTSFHDVVSEAIHTRQLAKNALQCGHRAIAAGFAKKWLRLLTVCASPGHTDCHDCAIARSTGNAHRNAHRHKYGVTHPSTRGWPCYASGEPWLSWHDSPVAEVYLYNLWIHMIDNMQLERARQINAGAS